MGTLLDSHHVVADATLYSWTGSEWRESSFTGGMAVEGGALSVIEFQIRTGELGNPALLNIAVLSPGRVLTRTAADVLGSDVTPRESTDAGIVSSFAHTELTSE